MNAFGRKTLKLIYRRLERAYGPQFWWPGGSGFEIVVGAVLTQNTAWIGAERAIAALKERDLLAPDRMLAVPRSRLARVIRPAGFGNVKAVRLHNVCSWLLDAGGMRALRRRRTDPLRRDLLSVNGIGPETADAVLLYALQRPVFVIDAYTRRLFSRLGLAHGTEPYETLRAGFESALAPDPVLFNEYHALIVRHGKERCVRSTGCRHCTVEAPLPGRHGR
jgi:endonuclease-3 related protein